MALDIKTASELASLIPTYDGNPLGVKSFNDAITLVETIVPAANTAAAIQLILTRLTGKARDLFTDVPATYAIIKQKISGNCTDKSSSELALANLKNSKPRKGQETSAFTKEIDTLADKLKQAYVREEVPVEVASKLSKKAAIQSLIAASNKQETKMLLKIGKFDNLSEALNIVIENENFAADQTAAMLQYNKNKYQNGKSNFNNRSNSNQYRGNNRNSQRYNSRQNNNRQYNGQQNQNNRSYSRGGYQNTNNQQRNGYQQNNNPNNRRVYQVTESMAGMPQVQFQQGTPHMQQAYGQQMQGNFNQPMNQPMQQNQQRMNNAPHGNFLGVVSAQHPYSQ